MKPVETDFLNPSIVKRALQGFWDESLEIKQSGKSLLIALPMSYPDGIQVVLSLVELTEGTARISDGGRTLQQLFAIGLNYNSTNSRTHALLQERLEAFEIRQDGLELFRQIAIPIQGIDLHLFGEALVSISHLFYRHDPAGSPAGVAYDAVGKILAGEPGFVVGKKLWIQGARRPITVDYYLPSPSPVAIEVIKRKGSIFSYMEQWGFRWSELKKENGKLLPAMVYDPMIQRIDANTLAIGKKVCSVFCSYQETNQLEHLLEMSKMN